jgi:pyrroloquinoline quinone biosynthesis protein A
MLLVVAHWATKKRSTDRRTTMQWTKPAFTDLRFGFEITMYIANR